MKNLLNKISGEVKFATTISGLRGGAKALLAVRTAHALQRPLIVITASEDKAAEMEQDLALFSKLPVLLYPGFDIPPYTPLSPDPTTVASQIPFAGSIAYCTSCSRVSVRVVCFPSLPIS